MKWITHLDRLLRGELTRPEELREGRVNIDTAGIAAVIVLLAMIYGLCMGSYSLLKEVPESVNDPGGQVRQVVASIVKVPALFYLTLFVTFPSLYVFNALVGSRLTLVSVWRLLLASLAVNVAVLASLGPIVMFFSLSTKGYEFIQLLNVAVFTVAGVLGLTFLLQTLHRLTTQRATFVSSSDLVTESEVKSDAGTLSTSAEPSALDMPEGESLGEHTRYVFGCWVVVFAVVGAQMGWVLRPFIGNPSQPFEWFRTRDSNFFEAVLNAVRVVLGGE